MAKINTIALTCDQRAALEKAARHSNPYAFRPRCQTILLKAQARAFQETITSARVSERLDAFLCLCAA